MQCHAKRPAVKKKVLQITGSLNETEPSLAKLVSLSKLFLRQYDKLQCLSLYFYFTLLFFSKLIIVFEIVKFVFRTTTVATGFF